MTTINTLVPVGTTNINNEEVNTVNARDLHEFLGVGKMFTNWIKDRLDTLGSEENKDFLVFAKIGKKGGRPKTEYYVTLDLAKHLAMMEKNEKGKEVRDYFIACEKKLKEISDKDSLLWDILKADDKINRAIAINNYELDYVKPLEQSVERMKPKEEYHDNVLNSETLLTTTQIAKDYGISAQKLNKILQEQGVQYKDQSDVWMLYAKHLNKQYAQTSTHTYEDNRGKQCTKLYLKWTQKGKRFIHDILAELNIYPVVVQLNQEV